MKSKYENDFIQEKHYYMREYESEIRICVRMITYLRRRMLWITEKQLRKSTTI